MAKTTSKDKSDFDKLETLILAADVNGIIAFFDGMSESQRLKYGSLCLHLANNSQQAFWDALITHRTYDESGYVTLTIQSNPKEKSAQKVLWVAKTALVASASWNQLKSYRWSRNDAEIAEVLVSRRPDWALKFFEKTVADDSGSVSIWNAYVRCLQEKIVSSERSDLMVELMFTVIGTSVYYNNRNEKNPRITIRDKILKSFDVLQHEIWKIFEIKTFRRNWCFTTSDQSDDWKKAFCEMVARNELSRERVIDGCFAALLRGFTDYQEKWFVHLLESLIKELPIDNAELLRDSDRYLALLEHRNPTARGLGLKITERLCQVELLDADAVLKHISWILCDPQKGKAQKGIALLDRLGKKSAAKRPEICRAVLNALGHEASDVQKSAIELLLKFDGFHDPGVVSGVKECFPSLAASVRAMLPPDIIEKEHAPKTSHPLIETAVANTTEPEPVRPIQTFEELLDVAAILLEDATDAMELERFLDGISRLGSNRPENFDAVTSPLLRRAFQRIGLSASAKPEEFHRFQTYPPFHADDQSSDFHYFLLGWLTGEMPKIVSGKMKVGKFTLVKPFSSEPTYCVLKLLAKRMKTILKRLLNGESFQLLSTPTHSGGWIDPIIFANRLVDDYSSRKPETPCDDYDRLLALLRLMPDRRRDALGEMDRSISRHDDYINAVRYALGAEDADVASGTTPQYWIAACRCRNPLESDPVIASVFGEYGPDGAVAAEYVLRRRNNKRDWGLLIPVETCDSQLQRDVCHDWALFPTVGFHVVAEEYYSEPRGAFDWFLTVWPQNMDAVTDLALKMNFVSLDRASKSEGLYDCITAMQTTNIPIRKIGIWALFTALAMKCPVVYTTATDTLIALVQDGRLAAEAAVSPARELLALHVLTLGRWRGPLKVIAEQSDHHAIFVHELLENIMPDLPAKDVGSFLELLYELVVSLNRPITLEKCRQFLESLKGSGKAAKMAKRLLGV